MADVTVDPQPTTKPAWTSKTILVNGVIGLAAFAAMFFPAAAGLKTFLDSNAAAIGAVWSVLNIVLRTITKDKITLGD